MGDLILWFENLFREDSCKAGAKYANLSELKKLGLPVVPSFAIIDVILREVY